MKSMTGFGVGDATTPVGRLVVEVRAVNHRFLDVRVRAPRDLGELVGFAEQLVRERLTRGRIDVGIRVEAMGGLAASLDLERARVAYRALCALRDELAPGEPMPIATLAHIPDLFVSASESERHALHVGCRAAFTSAVAALEAMRGQEGRALATDLTQRLSIVRSQIDVITARVPVIVEGYERRLRARLVRLLGDEPSLDGARVEQEVALLVDRSDVSEEITRLRSHCAQFDRAMAGAEGCGRRLDFLLQEMVREVNTIGSKAQDAEVAHAVVDVKCELERMREQVQNVE